MAFSERLKDAKNRSTDKTQFRGKGKRLTAVDKTQKIKDIITRTPIKLRMNGCDMQSRKCLPVSFTPGLQWSVTRSFVYCFVDRCLSFCPVSFDLCVFCLLFTASEYSFGIFKLTFSSALGGKTLGKQFLMYVMLLYTLGYVRRFDIYDNCINFANLYTLCHILRLSCHCFQVTEAPSWL